ncbi:PR-1-like protein [Alternaria alternata]|uniref:PR-1-like protein n=1 Tax=Alternaria alternata TaxID=5599 RepID=A0A177DTN0_ALTAL|nr:PR-1-like protein [Alternaria alternata]OAG22818.1 PR-1-like protein [Alternaria alternata]
MKIFASLLALTAVTAVAAPANEIRRRDLAADDAPHQDDPNLISAVMRAHWYWRRLHCAQDLVWDTELANAARADISECPKDPEHKRSGSNLSSVNPPPEGYDAWVEFARTATHGWHEEETKYPYDNPHFDPAWGHFSQMVWRNSTRLGCALGHCPSDVNWPGRFYCYYSFFGNNIAAGQFEAQVWAPVCKDPDVAEVTKREDVNFNWARV